MNWYFEERGVSQGPFLEERMLAKFKAGELTRDVLIWQPEMKEWRSAQEVKPEWVSDAKSPLQRVEPNPPPSVGSSPVLEEPKQKVKTPEAKAPEAKPVTGSLVESKTETAAPLQSPKAAPAQSKLKPKAPVETLAAEAPKSGLLKRVFGLGGKKKG